MRRNKVMWGLASAIVLALVFASYLQRDFVFGMANQIWACF